MARTQNKPKKPKIPTELEFDFIKSNFFRVIRADGFFGGLTPNGSNIHVGVYSERHAYPQKIFHKIVPAAGGHTLGPEEVERRVARSGIVRELEVGISMDISQAIVLRNWLNEKLAQYEQIVGPLPVMVETAKVNVGPLEKASNGEEKK